MIRYFQKGFRPSVSVKIEHRGRELDSFKELVKKTVNGKPNAALQPRSYTCKTNQHCLRGSQPLATKASNQSQPMKDSRVKKPKSKPQKLKTLAPQHSNNAETSKKAWKKKEKKKKDRKHWQCCRSDNKSPRATPATRGNTTKYPRQKFLASERR